MACFTVTATGPDPSSGKVRPANCASTILLISVKGTSIGTPITTPPGDGGMMSILAGNGQLGLVSAEVMRVSASMPSVTVTAEASTLGCIAIARFGLSSSQSGGKVEPAPVPCSGMERQALAHCVRAFCSKLRSLRTRASTAVTCSATVLSIRGLTCAGTLTRAPATTRLVSPSVTCAARFGSRCQAAASFGREVKVTVPLISALALSDLMFTLPICLATLPPSTPASASPTAPVAFDDSEPVTLSFPVSGVASDSTSWPPVATIGPREAVQPMSAFCRICDTGLSALPAKLWGAARSAASRIAVSAITTGASTKERFDTGGNGGSSTSSGAGVRLRGAIQSMAFRLTKNETATTAIPTRIVLRLSASRIIPPG